MLLSWKGSGGGNPRGSRKWLPILAEPSSRPGGDGTGIRSPDTYGSSSNASACPANAPGAVAGSASAGSVTRLVRGPAGELGEEGDDAALRGGTDGSTELRIAVVGTGVNMVPVCFEMLAR